MPSKPEYAKFSPLQSQSSLSSCVVWSGGSKSWPPANQPGQASLSAGGGIVKYKGKYMLLTVNSFLGDSESEAVVTPSNMAEEPQFQAIERIGFRGFRNDHEDMTQYISLHSSLESSASAPRGNGGCQAAASATTNGQTGNQVKTILRTAKLLFALFWVTPEMLSPSLIDNAISFDSDDGIEPGPRLTTVRAVTPTSGTVEGALEHTTWIVRPPDTRDCVEVLLMRCPPLRPGDRGSLVVDKTTGRLFGHVIHYHAPNHLALVMPAKLVADHARRVLDQRAGATTPTPSLTAAQIPTTTSLMRINGLGIVRLLLRFPQMGPQGSIVAVTIPELPEDLPNGEIRLRYNEELGDGPPGVPLTRPLNLMFRMSEHLPMDAPGARPMSISFFQPGLGTVIVPITRRNRAGLSWRQMLDSELRRYSDDELRLASLVFHLLGLYLMSFGGDFFICLWVLCFAANCVCIYGR